MRLISFFLTQDQIQKRTKDVTRRGGWEAAKAGDILLGVVKGQGIPKGESAQPLCIIEILSARREPLDRMISDPVYGYSEVRREGFPAMRPVEFVVMYREHNGGDEDQEITRIEFKYREDLWREYQAAQAIPSSIPIPSTPKKDLKMAKEKKTKPPMEDTAFPPGGEAMDESKALDEKGAIDKAISASAVERPGVPSDPAFEKAPDEAAAAPVAMPKERTFVQDLDPSEALPTFQKIVFLEYTESEYAARGKELAGMFEEQRELETQMAEVMKEWKDKIKAVESRKDTLAAQIASKGEEKEIECRKRINEKEGTATIFNAATLEIVEERKLTNAELQTELRFQEQYKAARDAAPPKPPKGTKIIDGKFPKDQKVGAAAKENPEEDAKNDAAVKALAGKKD